jgi:histidinol-phosphate aminotransferase
MAFTARPTAPIAALKAYDPGHELAALRARFAPRRLAELGSNENPLGPSPAVLARLAALTAEEVLRYPDPMGLALRRRLATNLGVRVDEIVLGNGSHELLILLAQCFAGPGDKIVFSEFGFAVFPIATAAVGATAVRVPALGTGAAMPRGHDLGALASSVDGATGLVYLANPNNPTGTWFERDALARFVTALPATVPVVVDEAYHEYVDDPSVGSALELRARHPNLIVTRTFSKGYGLAGLRLGYAVADRAVIDVVNRLRESFNANAAAQIAAETALSDPAHLERSRAHNRRERERVARAARSLGLAVSPSLTNFLLIDFARPAAPIEARLLEAGVVVRPMGGYGLPTCVRVSIGSEAENDAFLAALPAALA